MSIKKKFFAFLLLISLNYNVVFALGDVENTQKSLYPDYSKEFVGEDKYENFNRKMFLSLIHI